MNLREGSGNRVRVCFLALLLSATVPNVPATETPPARAAQAVVLRIAGGRLEGGVRTLRFTRGDRVVLRVTSDQKLNLHLHGYDIELPVSPAMEATLIVDARIAGRFPLSAHFPSANAKDTPRERTLLYLEVLPE